MKKYRIDIVGKEEAQIHEIESLRKEVFHLKLNSPDHYMRHIMDGKIIPFALYDENCMIGGCYVGEAYDSLYIYFLFIKEEYQKTGLMLGRRLLQEIIHHKEEVEDLLDTSFTKSSLHPASEGLKKVYQSIGYQCVTKGIMVRGI